MVGKQALQSVSEKHNKATTTRDSIIVAAESYNTVMQGLEKIEQEKNNQEQEKDNAQKLNIQDLKSAEKLVLNMDDIEGR